MGTTTETARTTTVLYVIVVVVAVLISTVLAPVVWNATTSSSDDDPSVAVITLRGGTSDANVNAITDDLRDARTNDSVEAVVFRIDSSGGGVAPSEELYLAVNRTAQEMPVVAYVEGVAASGGYYGIVPADQIFVKSSSTVGSVGVIVQAPLSTVDQQERAAQSYIRSGPDKALTTRDKLRNRMETLQNAFLNTVMTHRGENITLDRQGVSRADTYLGPTAVRNGFADRIGDLDAAIEDAARRADSIDGDQYDVTYYEPPEITTGLLLAQDEIEGVDGDVVYVESSATDEFEDPVRFYYVWGVPTETVSDETEVTTDASG